MGKFRVENGKILGGETFFGGKCLEKVIGNLVCREMLFYKEALITSEYVYSYTSRELVRCAQPDYITTIKYYGLQPLVK